MAGHLKLPNIIDQEVGKRLYKLRIAKGLSRKELASLVSITQQQIEKYEKATNRITVSRLIELSQILGQDIQYFTMDIKNLVVSKTETQQDIEAQRLRLEGAKELNKIKNKHLVSLVVALIRDISHITARSISN